LMSSNFTR